MPPECAVEEDESGPRSARPPPPQPPASAAALPSPAGPLGSPFELPVRGDALLRRLERGFLYFDRALGRLLPEALNPFLHTGAVAILNLAVATVSGVAILFWYSPSVHHAYASVADLPPYGAGLLRSLHRYSSDACMFFALVHALRLFLERRFTGARWLAWVTGLAALALLWLIGWTGYWLVWDARAQHVAEGTARALDAIPIFVDPMSRSFLTDEGVNSLLFFVVFFVHMLIPLGLGIALWLHLARLARPRFLSSAPMTVWVLGSLLLLSAAHPARNAEPARMTALSQSFRMDWWYLAPLALTDRVGGGALWALLWGAGAALGAVPWSMGRGRARPARVDPLRCNACGQCYQDCPYDAIAMVPRTEGRLRYALQAEVDPAKCLACGICAGSCDSVGVGLDDFDVAVQRLRLDAWIEDAFAHDGAAPHVAFVCAESAGGGLRVDPSTGRCDELPGYRVLEIPCAGWIHPLSLERALRRGAAGALVVACCDGECRYREGTAWTLQRLGGERTPSLRTEKVDRERVQLVQLDRTRAGALSAAAQAFREPSDGRASRRTPSRALAAVAATILAVLVSAGVGLVSDLGYSAPLAEGSELVVSFKHPGVVGEHCRDVSEEEQARLPVHMRRSRICDRGRASVRLRVSLDGERVLERSYAPSGLWSDGNSIAIERIPVAAGEHRVEVAIGDTLDPEEWSLTTQASVSFRADARRVLSFDRLAGFTWH